MNSSFEQGENDAFSANGDDKRNPNAKAQMANKAQMPKCQRGWGLGIEFIELMEFIEFIEFMSLPSVDG